MKYRIAPVLILASFGPAFQEVHAQVQVEIKVQDGVAEVRENGVLMHQAVMDEGGARVQVIEGFFGGNLNFQGQQIELDLSGDGFGSLEPIAPLPPFQPLASRESARQETKACLDQLREGSFRERRQARDRLNALLFPEEELLRHACGDPDPEVKLAAEARRKLQADWMKATFIPWLHTLADQGEPSAFEFLTSAGPVAADTGWERDWGRAWARCMPDAQQRPGQIEQDLYSAVSAIRWQAALQLARMEPAGLRSRLEKADLSSFPRLQALLGALRLQAGEREGWPLLLTGLRSASPWVRSTSASWLAAACGKPLPAGWDAPGHSSDQRKAAVSEWISTEFPAGMPAPSAFEIFPGKRSLYNGGSLDGWTFHSPQRLPMEEVWNSTNAVLTAQAGAEGVLMHELPWEEFRLHLEWQLIAPGHDSGVFFFVEHPDRPRPNFLEVQLLDGQAGDIWLNTSFPVHDQGQLRTSGKIARRMQNLEHAVGEWNRLEVEFRNGTLHCKVNGKLCNSLEGLPRNSLPLGLQLEGDPIQFRNIVVEPLD